jgi:hypothetical protein
VPAIPATSRDFGYPKKIRQNGRANGARLLRLCARLLKL